MSGLLLVVLLAAAPAPRAAPHSGVVIHVPQPDRIGGAISFFERAGKHSALLDPAAWRSELFPLFTLDPARPATFGERGLDPSKPLTLSVFDNTRLSCATVGDVKRFEAQARERLLTMGDPWKGKSGTVGAVIDGTPVAAYVLKGKNVCAVVDPQRTERVLPTVAKLAGSNPAQVKALGTVKGTILVHRQGDFALGLDGTPQRLDIDGMTPRVAEPRLRNQGHNVYGGLKRSGIAVLRAKLAPESVRWAVMRMESTLAPACPGCDRRSMIELLATIGDTLNGDVAWRVDRVRVVGSLRQPGARFFALKQALVAYSKDPAAAKRRLAEVEKWPNARPTARGFALKMEGGEVEVGLSGNHFFLANDEGALTTLLQELPPQPAAQAHGAELELDPKLLNKAFAQVSLLDLMTSRELAPIVAVGTELGPLLGASTEVRAWADSSKDGAHRFGGQWLLDPQ